MKENKEYRDAFLERDYTNKLLILYEDGENLSPPSIFEPKAEIIGFGKMSIQGVSIFVNLDGLRMLVDTTTDVSILKNNTRVLGIDPASIDVMLLTHVHFDHVHAYKFPLTQSPEMRVYGPMTKRWLLDNDPWMNPPISEEMLAGYMCVEDWAEVGPGVWMITTESFVSDHLPFSPVKETTLVIESNEGLILVTGDCHPSPARIIDKAKAVTGVDSVYLLAGGTSLVWLSDAAMSVLVDQIHERRVKKLAPVHTSGDAAKEYMAGLWGDDLISAATGTVIDIPV